MIIQTRDAMRGKKSGSGLLTNQDRMNRIDIITCPVILSKIFAKIERG